MVSKGKDAAYRVRHAHILLNTDESVSPKPDGEVGQMLSCHANTVAGVRRRFVEQGLEVALERKNENTHRFPLNSMAGAKRG